MFAPTFFMPEKLRSRQILKTPYRAMYKRTQDMV